MVAQVPREELDVAVATSAPATGRRAVFRRAAGNRPLVIAALVVIGAAVLCAAIPSVLSPQDPLRLNPTQVLQGPAANHLLGTDQYGRGILGQLVYGARDALLIGAVSVLGGFIVGGLIGVVSGFMGGAVDMTLMRVIDVLMCFPGIILALLISAALGAGLTNEIIAVAVSFIPIYARVMRGQALAIRSRLYIDAAIATGIPKVRIVLRHILPNAIAPLVVLATIGVGTAIVIGASLSFLGLGPQNGVPDWGRLLASGEDYISTAWWISTFPGLVITLVVIAVNILGDWLRDRLDVAS